MYDAVLCRLSLPARTPPRICTRRDRLPALAQTTALSLVAPRAALGLPELVHLGHPLLELDVLALLVAVSLVLRHTASVGRVPSMAAPAVASPPVGLGRALFVPRTSTACRMSRSDTD